MFSRASDIATAIQWHLQSAVFHFQSNRNDVSRKHLCFQSFYKGQRNLTEPRRECRWEEAHLGQKQETRLLLQARNAVLLLFCYAAPDNSKRAQDFPFQQIAITATGFRRNDDNATAEKGDEKHTIPCTTSLHTERNSATDVCRFHGFVGRCLAGTPCFQGIWTHVRLHFQK